MHQRQDGHLHPNAYKTKLKTQFCPRCYVITMVLFPILIVGKLNPVLGPMELRE